MSGSYWIETLGCPKNQVDSDKLATSLLADGYRRAENAESADLVVVNTCAFIDSARQESIDTVLALSDARQAGAKLVVTGCFAARAGEELAAAMPEVDLVTDVGVPISFGPGPRFRKRDGRIPSLDLLEMGRPPAEAPWAYVKVAEGCDRACGFCAIPSFRGKQRSRSQASILSEIEQLEVKEIILVAQDLASYGRDIGHAGALIDLIGEAAKLTERVRLLYLYPSSLTDRLIETIVGTGVAYFDLSLQHVSGPLLRRMRRYGNASRFLERIEKIRQLAPDAALRSSFILGYPGETEEDHDALLGFLEQAELDWIGLFPFSEEPGTLAASQSDKVPGALALERLRECAELQDGITARRRRALVGSTCDVLVDSPGLARSHREAPEIDGVIRLSGAGSPGELRRVLITDAEGPDLFAKAVATSRVDQPVLSRVAR